MTARYDYPTFLQAVARRDGPQACWGCHLQPWTRSRCLSLSAGLYDAHHFIAKQTIKREFPHGALRLSGPLEPLGRNDDPTLYQSERVVTTTELLIDPRNGVLMGRWHHDQLEARMLRPTFDDLPAAAVAFAVELGLLHRLERTYPA